jgi:histone deacetylase 1/2
MISPSRPSNSLHDNSDSPASNPIPSPLQNNTDPSPSPSPPRQPVLDTHPMITRSKNNIHKPKILSDHHIRYPIPKALMTTLQPQNREPTCYSTAVKHHHWREAMNKEFDALLANGTWTLVPKPPTANLVGCKWVYKVKRKADGNIERFKARLLAKGFHQ